MLDGKEIDIYLPDHNIGIEFHGLFWHNDLRIDKNYHRNKLNVAKSKQIKLIQIFEDEWEHKKEIVKSRLMNLLHISSSTVYARKCKVVLVKPSLAKQFFNNNHIQGHARAKFTLGLELNSELVSAMSFSSLSRSKGQIQKEGHFELLRFCSKVHTTVTGGASRLFSNFVSTYNPINVLSYADLRWSTGDVYGFLGFTYERDTVPGYWYINLRNIERIHRYRLRKNSNDNQVLTEYENRLNEGYLRIWDCGHAKYTWTKKP